MTSKGFSIDNIVKAANKTSDKKKAIVNDKDSPKKQPQVNDLLKTKKKKKKPRYVYLENDTDKALGKLSDRIGKSNGGASAIVEAALEEFFNNHDFSAVIGDYRT